MFAASVNCDREFSSAAAREGEFSSPDYPNPHPGDIECRYRFHGHGRERVQIIFTDVDLNKPSASMPTKTKLAFSFSISPIDIFYIGLVFNILSGFVFIIPVSSTADTIMMAIIRSSYS